ncbi:ATP-binding protein [Rhodoferax saidenbachensis]|uniref:histidine kinase n=1 Tax=Rhodoferax saidenbachensis TaxID=1484693 RepID=A0ABU1ZSU8_9BURK|nr:ATP-binding protein [Rhodoferax saidenbachensis]MDR7308634.1 two-component system C4-dicarboxylate transport sensor histidine kinase DctB [Rhodoferax saidenbachensis]
MVRARRLVYWSGALALAAGLVLAAYWLGARNADENTHLTGERQLQIIALDLEAVLDRFDTLPYSIAHLPLTSQLLAAPANTGLQQELNGTLQDLALQAKVAAIYLMDKTGKTIAASNWDTSQSYIGQNFGFRPYFRDAIQGQPGYFYAIGNTTNIPGYFISQAVYPVGVKRGSVASVGVIAVKITLESFEKTWRSNEDPIALVDRHGVVFLSNRSEWVYNSLQPLTPLVQSDIEQTQQYMGKQIQPIASLSRAARKGFGEYMGRPVGRLGWQLMLFPSQAKVVRAGMLWAGITVLLLLVAAAVAAMQYQRRRRLEERSVAQQALKQAADDLEHHIAQRTQELLSANAQLAAKYNKLQQTENLLRTTRNEMVQAGKLAMLGQMAAGITHELNQPLTAIRAFADNASTYLSRGQTAQADDNLRHISAASARMGSIVGQLKGFARKSAEAVAVVKVNQAIQDAAFLLDSEFARHGVQLQLDLPETFYVLGDTVRVEQVLINLLRNALDAVEHAPEKIVRVMLEADAQQVRVHILDSGMGLPQEVVKHLFEPFFTTKPTGHGLGLGLAISSSIVQAMNGHLEARNASHGGAEFVVYVPRCAQERQPT